MRLAKLSKVHPTGFEPVTFGSVDRGDDRVTSNDNKDLRDEQQPAVPATVPSQRETVLSTGSILTSGSEESRLLDLWHRLPSAFRAEFLAMMEAYDSNVPEQEENQ